MRMHKVKSMNEYFEWMYGQACTDSVGNYIPNYKELLHYLNAKQFNYTLAMDGNRESDGIYLRYLYSCDVGMPAPVAASEIDIYPCSMLEMMIALCRRMEEVMSDSDYGDRTGQWFFEMIESLGLIDMVDGNFNFDICEEAMERFINRTYEPNGKGGLFTLKFSLEYPPCDVRNLEIWDQAMMYLNEVE